MTACHIATGCGRTDIYPMEQLSLFDFLAAPVKFGTITSEERRIRTHAAPGLRGGAAPSPSRREGFVPQTPLAGVRLCFTNQPLLWSVRSKRCVIVLATNQVLPSTA